MYSFTRTASLHNAAVAPRALGFGIELAGYLNKTYNLKLRCGLEMFGTANIHWQFDVDTLDALAELNKRLFDDKAYWAMLDKVKDLWVPGSMRDTVVQYQK